MHPAQSFCPDDRNPENDVLTNDKWIGVKEGDLNRKKN